MKKHFSTILFIIGALIFLFPFALRLVAHFSQTTAVYNYKSSVSSLSQEEILEKKNASDEYNETLLEEETSVSLGEELNSQDDVVSSFDFLKTGEVIGTLTIPTIGVELPIYDGLEDNNLLKGVVHLENTSYPTAKESTHCVIAGHSGLTSAKILDDLDQLALGDYFQIEYLNETTYYKIIDIRVVLPDDTESLNVIEGETLVTLVTCTPKSINTHRLLVTGQKSDPPEEQEITLKQKIINFIKSYCLYIIFVLLFIIFIVIIAVYNKIRNKKYKNR